MNNSLPSSLLESLKKLEEKNISGRKICLESEELIKANRLQFLYSDIKLFSDFCKYIYEISKSSMSSGWCLAVWNTHSYIIHNFFDESLINDILKNGPLVSAVIPAPGKFEKLNDGFEVEGHFKFASGVENSDYFFCSALCKNDCKDERYFLFETKNLKIIDTWHTMGMKGTGSQDVIVEKKYVSKIWSTKKPDKKKQIQQVIWKKTPIRCVLFYSLGSSVMGHVESIIRLVEEKYIQSIEKNLFKLESYLKIKTLFKSFKLLFFSNLNKIDDISIDEDESIYFDLSYSIQKINNELLNLFLKTGSQGVYDNSELKQKVLDLSTACFSSTFNYHNSTQRFFDTNSNFRI